mgnify:CR=1 FL=1
MYALQTTNMMTSEMHNYDTDIDPVYITPAWTLTIDNAMMLTPSWKGAALLASPRLAVRNPSFVFDAIAVLLITSSLSCLFSHFISKLGGNVCLALPKVSKY